MQGFTGDPDEELADLRDASGQSVIRWRTDQGGQVISKRRGLEQYRLAVPVELDE